MELFNRIRVSGIVVLISSALGLLVGPLFQPIFVPIGKNAQGQTLLANLYDGFIPPFNQQA